MRVISPTLTYLKEVRLELKRVNWPRKEDTMRYTLLVIGMSAAVGIFLGGLDFLFSRLLQPLITR